MRNAFLLLFLGLLAFAGYSFWADPQGFRQKFAAGQDAPGKVAPDTASNVVAELATYTSKNMEAILSSIATEGVQVATAPVADLKMRLNAELSKFPVPAEKARLQRAVQLAGVIEQAIAQRAAHVKRRQSAEYREPPPTGSKTKVSPSETTAKIRQAEFFTQGVERRWAELAAQYRVAMGRLLASLSA